MLGAAVTATTLVLAGCAPASTDDVVSGSSGEGTTSASDGLTLAEVKESGKLTIGTEGTYPPFSFHADGGTGALTGYDIDVVTAVAEKLGVEPDFQETQWDAIFAGLDGGRFEVIANQVAINDERQAKYDFSTPYSVSPGVVIVPSSDTSITDLAGLSGKTTAQSLSSNWYAVAQQNGAQVEGVEGWAQAIALVEQGRVDATVNDRLTWLDWSASYPDQAAGLKVAATTADTSASAFAFPKGSDDLVAAVDSALDELRADGTLVSLSERYFGADVSQ
ncbi:polar amino acid ABC transporter substrate-binding protein [Rathayibacter rathayi]|uniref:Polar amino acid ABC transporter substrate-binding protein n=1 Tax=Rathayibacter rathayi TaxID=33887 RepID=A0ABD6W758_RATRA|nr:polar amino acid ABC transporter substrate-binding protein [Rathayibacter rathayi]PPG87495.1 polar amino acid ABC transporter substrate-binding protein [Rathayibacter rathayi]PPG98374.1 polar amino acid ABC transporter substrate-binding protein [Rathayibacter rathayi]PPI00576.1 polar amino acid ABC transporter substrate-binding protein [Rathayibacter rathayi]PPI11317.1 polar amino acid ABC transporter substrate-binding protein [Rathayibacter rathayi]